MSQTSIRIAIVNDYEVVVAGLARMLQLFSDRLEIVELDANVSVRRHVDVALYDTFGQAHNGEFDYRAVTRSSNADRLVIYSWSIDAEVARRCIEDGASGYLSKQLGAKELVTAIERVHAGERLVELDAGDGAGPAPESDPQLDLQESCDWPGRRNALNERESEILALIVQGLSNDQIASRAYLSINTVKTYIRTAYRKMGVHSRSQAVLWGIDHGFRPDLERVN